MVIVRVRVGLVVGLGYGKSRVRVRFRGRFRCQLIIDSWLLVHDPPGSGSGCRYTIHDLNKNFMLAS